MPLAGSSRNRYPPAVSVKHAISTWRLPWKSLLLHVERLLVSLGNLSETPDVQEHS